MTTITSKTGMIAEINEFGAQLSRLADEKTEYLWDGNPDIWPKHAPVLFPFVGRMPNQKYHYQGKEYEIPLHGFAPYSNFALTEKSEDSATFSLIVTDEIKAMYPFDFGFSVTYSLSGDRLTVTYKAENKGSDVMYYGLGSHPGFNVPLKEGLKFEDYYVEFPESTEVMHRLFTPACLDSHKEVPYEEIKDKKLALRHNLFDNDAVLLKNTGNRCIIKTDKDNTAIQVEYPDTPWCAVWHKVKMEVPFVCIEPWFCLPGDEGENDIARKPDFFSLRKGESRYHNLIIEILK